MIDKDNFIKIYRNKINYCKKLHVENVNIMMNCTHAKRI